MLNTACGDSQSASLPCIADPLRGRLLRVPASRRRLASRLSARRIVLALHVAHHPKFLSLRLTLSLFLVHGCLFQWNRIWMDLCPSSSLSSSLFSVYFLTIPMDSMMLPTSFRR